MAITPLREYNREIEGMIDNGQLDEAVAHCRHILTTFPKHIATYRLLGKAHLEQQRISDATDIFQRVLSSVPDDFIANVGMSIIREDENNLDSSIWHMELAYEAQPANAAIQDELRRLYGRRDGVQPAKVRLTRGALARMYSKGGLFDQAIAELRAAIAEDPNRPDLQLLLAEMFFQTNQRVEAVETCANTIKKLPLCLEANRILAISLPDAEGSEAVKNYRQIVVSLDPYYAFASPEAISSEQVPENAVNIERLDYKSGIQVTEAPVQPNWATSLGISIEKPVDDSVPDWLKAAEATPQPVPSEENDTSKVSPFIWDTQEVTNLIKDSAKSDTEIPDWMKDAGWQPASGRETPPSIEKAPEKSEQINPASEGLEKAEIPDWLQGIAPEGVLGEDKAAAESTESNLSTPWLEQHQPGPTDSIIHWLEDNQPEKPRSRPPREEAAIPLSEEEVPDWLKDLEPEVPAPATSAEANAPIPAFTVEPTELTEHPAKPDVPAQTSTPFNVPLEEDLPEMTTAKESAEEPVDEIPDWLKDLAGEVPLAEDATPAGEPIPAEPMPGEVPQTPEIDQSLEKAPNAEEQPSEAIQGVVEETKSEIEPSPKEEISAAQVPEITEEAPLETPAMGEEPESIVEPGLAGEEVPAIEVAPVTLETPSVEATIPGEQEITPEVGGFVEELPPAELPLEPQEAPATIPSGTSEEPLPLEAELPVSEIKPAEEENALAWLEDIAAEQSTKVETGPSASGEGEILPPEWVKLESEPPIDDLTSLEGKSLEGSAVPAEEIPDWIKGLGEEPETIPPTEERAPTEIPEVEMTPSDELPDWLRELEEPEKAKAPDEEALEWKADEMPDWLKEIAETEPAVGQPAPAEAKSSEVPETVEITPTAKSATTEVPEVFGALGETEAEQPETPESLIMPEVTPTEAPEAIEAPIVAEAAPVAAPEAIEAPAEAELQVTPEAIVAPIEAEPAPAEAPEVIEATVEAEAAPAEAPEVIEAPVTAEAAPAEAPEVIEAPAAAEAPPAEAPEVIEAPVTAEAAPAEAPEVIEATVEAGLPLAPEAMVTPIEAEAASVEAPEVIETTVEAEAAPPGMPPTEGAPITVEVPPSTLEPATEWSSEVTPPAGIKSIALEEPTEEQVFPAAEETPSAEELPTPSEEISLEAFKAASTANQAILLQARNAVNMRQPIQAVEFYQGLVKQGYHVDEIIKDLQAALYHFPVNIDIWITLGDAYFRTDDLAEALNAYTRAEELVR